MKNPPGYGSIVDLGKNRRRPIAVRVPNGKKFNKQGKEIIDYKYLGYFERTVQGKKEAQVLLANYNSGVPVELQKKLSQIPTFKELSIMWMEKHLERIKTKKGQVSRQLKDSYNAAILKCSSIHGKRIDLIKFQDVQDIADSVQNMSNSTVMNVKTVLFETFDLARKQKYITENFVGDVEFISSKKDGRIHSSFGREEVSLLWANSDNVNVKIVIIMIYTGLRIEELLSMKTENIYFNKKYMVGGVKTDAGKNRIIPIADKILPFILEIYDEKNIYLIKNNSSKNRYTRTEFVKKIWNPTMDYLNMKHLPHDTRYTCASMMDRAGISENSKKTILGHAKEGITNKVYVQKDLRDLLDAINMI